MQTSQRLKEKNLLFHLPADLSRSKDEREVLRILSDYLMNVFGVSSVLCSAYPEHLELIRGEKAYSLAPTKWPLRDLGKKLLEVRKSGKGVRLCAANWLPGTLGFFDERFGLFSASNGLLLEMDLSTYNHPNINQLS